MDKIQLMPKKNIISWHFTRMRWIVLLLACLFQMGNYYCSDFPAVLKQEILDDFKVNSFQYNLLYSVYGLPNIVLPFFGGFILDAIGIRIGLVGFYVFLVIGQICNFMGVITNDYYLLIIGQAIYGLGGENCQVAQNLIVSKWFKNKELSLALGINITISRLGSILNTTLSPQFYSLYNSLILPFFAGILFLLFSWLTGIILALLDKKSDSRDNISQDQNDEVVTFSDIKKFSPDLWLAVVSCMLIYINIFVFQQNNIPMFRKFFNLTEANADIMYNIPYYISALLTPILGIVVDKIGKRPQLLILSSLINISVNLLYLLCPTDSQTNYFYPILGQTMIGIFYSIYVAVLWACIPFCVKSQYVGTAFGLTSSIQNLGLTLGPLVVGTIIMDEDISSYKNMMLFFLINSFVGLLANSLLFLYDHQKNDDKLSKVMIIDDATIVKNDGNKNGNIVYIQESNSENQNILTEDQID